MLAVKRGDEGLVEEIRKEALCGIVSGVTQEPPWWVTVCANAIYTTRRPLYFYQIGPFLNNPR